MLTVGAVAEVAEALVPVTGTRHADEAVAAVDHQTAVSRTTHERRLAGYSRIQSRRIHDTISGQHRVHRQLVVHRSA